MPRLPAPSLSLTRAQYTQRSAASPLAGYRPGRVQAPARRPRPVVCTPVAVVPSGLLGAEAAAEILRMPVRLVRSLAVSNPELLPAFTLSTSGEPCFAPQALEGWR